MTSMRSRLPWPSARPPMTLQRRLVLTSVALIAAACAVLGVAGVLTLRTFLVDRLDSQLTAAAGRSNHYPGPPSPLSRPTTAVGGDSGGAGQSDQGHEAPPFLGAPGQGAGTLAARITDGQVVEAGVLTSEGGQALLPARDFPALAGVPADGVPRTVDLGELGGYRVAATRMADGDVRLTGLPMSAVSATVGNLAAVAAGVGVVVLVVAASVGTALTKRTLRPLARVASTASVVTTLPLHEGEVSLRVRVPPELTDDRTEVGKVGAALNQLIDHVGSALEARQASETKVRQFVADASHELRTPLAAIRGYAELTRRSRDATPPEVGAALDRVEAAAVRMTGLVEDLLLLARLDAGRPVELAPVDLITLCVENVADAQVAGPDHVWSVRLPGSAADGGQARTDAADADADADGDGAPVVVLGDHARLHQVIANLLANARIHTPAGTHVELRLDVHPGSHRAGADRAQGQEVVLEVVDDGPGIPAALVPTVFERFARADSSRSRAAGSTGLGLAIVAAVVEAHGGTVTVESEPGRTVVRVVLPSAAAPIPTAGRAGPRGGAATEKAQRALSLSARAAPTVQA